MFSKTQFHIQKKEIISEKNRPKFSVKNEKMFERKNDHKLREKKMTEKMIEQCIYNKKK